LEPITYPWPAVPPRILLVCTANICRSPMAEAVLRKLCMKARADVDIDSAATHSYMNGMPPFPLAVATAKARGFDVTKIVARTIRGHDFRYFDVILGMDRTHVDLLKEAAPPEYAGKVQLLLAYGARYRNCDIPDPYGGDAADFEAVLDMIEDGCGGFLRSYVRRAMSVRRHRQQQLAAGQSAS
jgi:protein-tyrosine phosphatase